MANRADMEAYFIVELGMVYELQAVAALVTQGFGSYEEVSMLRKEDIARICTNIRRPGGMIADAAGNMVPNQGIPIGIFLETRLKQLWLYCRHAYMIQRVHIPGTLPGLPSIEVLHDLDQWMSSFQVPEKVKEVPQFPGSHKARQWFEQFDEYLGHYIGPSGLPLQYVVRKEHDITEPDEGWYLPSYDEEIYSRGRHGGAGWQATYWMADNTVVWIAFRTCWHPTKEY